MTDAAFWAVAQTESRREFSVEHRLKDAGLETYLPRCKENSRVVPLLRSAESRVFFPPYDGEKKRGARFSP